MNLTEKNMHFVFSERIHFPTYMFGSKYFPIHSKNRKTKKRDGDAEDPKKKPNTKIT